MSYQEVLNNLSKVKPQLGRLGAYALTDGTIMGEGYGYALNYDPCNCNKLIWNS